MISEVNFLAYKQKIVMVTHSVKFKGKTDGAKYRAIQKEKSETAS